MTITSLLFLYFQIRILCFQYQNNYNLIIIVKNITLLHLLSLLILEKDKNLRAFIHKQFSAKGLKEFTL